MPWAGCRRLNQGQMPGLQEGRRLWTSYGGRRVVGENRAAQGVALLVVALTPTLVRSRKCFEPDPVSRDQCQLLGPSPSFQLPLALSCGSQVRMRFQVHELSKAKDPGCSDTGSKLVFDAPSIRIVCDSDVEPPVSKFGDIDPVVVGLGHRHRFSVALRLRRLWGLRPRSGHSTRASERRMSVHPGGTEGLAMSERNDQTARVEWLGR